MTQCLLVVEGKKEAKVGEREKLVVLLKEGVFGSTRDD
jgi:hypothetical protein